MPKPSQRADVNNFIGGLITEASVLNFPPNASADELNFELNRDGSRQRRLGMDFESGSVLTAVVPDPSFLTNAAYNSFVWENVSGDPTVSLVVIQINQDLRFYNLNQATISTGGPLGTLTLNAFPANTIYSFAALEGFLVAVGGADSFAVITCNTSNFTFSVNYNRIGVRDHWGVQEKGSPATEADPTFRPATLDDYHNYNLRNQSWGIPRKDKTGTLRDPVTIFNEEIHTYPNSTEQVWVGLQQQPVAQGQDPFERIYPSLYNDALGATTTPAKGYFGIDLLRRGGSRVEAFNANSQKYPPIAGTVNLGSDLTPGGPRCLADFAGRVFYSGFEGSVIGGDSRSPNLDNYIVFTQLVKSQSEFSKCYSEGDPTSRDTNDIVDTDGGFVRVSGARNIIALVNLQTHLIIIAENGVFTLTGGTTDSGFSATNYKVSKISTYGGISPTSIVSAGDSAYYWSPDGIYIISKNQYGDMQVQSLTLTTIQSLYEDIPSNSKQFATGQYDPFGKKVRWIYKTGVQFSATSATYELIFDLATKAITQNQVFNTVSNAVEVVGIFRTNAFISASTDQDVFAGVDQVFSNTDNVVVADSSSASSIQALRYIALVNNVTVNLGFSFYRENTWTDWISVDGVGADAKAHCLTGTITAGDSAIDKQTPYLIMHFNRSETGVDSDFQPIPPSGCLMRTQWNFANSVVSNKWSPLVQAYRYTKPRLVESLLDTYDTGFQLITTKNKVRGSGRAFALYFETEPKKDLKILGWNITINGNQTA